MKRKILTKNIYCILLLFIAVAAFLSGCERKKVDNTEKAYEIVRPYEKGPLSVSQKIDKSKINLSELINMQLVAVSPEGYEVDINDVATTLEDFSVLKWKKENNRLDPNNNIVRTYDYQLEPSSDGTLKLPPVTFKFTTSGADKKTCEIVTEPVDIDVVTTIVADPNKPVEIADIEDVVEMKTNVLLWLLAGLAVLVVFILLMAVIYSKKKQQVAITRIYKPAHEIALEKLAQLEKENLLIKGLLKLFYEKISGILRHYIEDRFELNAPERTTEEFLAELKYSAVLSGEDKDILAQFLQQCDLVKFAKHQPGQQQVESTFTIVRDFVEKTKSQEKQIDVTDTQVSGGNIENGNG